MATSRRMLSLNAMRVVFLTWVSLPALVVVGQEPRPIANDTNNTMPTTITSNDVIPMITNMISSAPSVGSPTIVGLLDAFLNNEELVNNLNITIITLNPLPSSIPSTTTKPSVTGGPPTPVNGTSPPRRTQFPSIIPSIDSARPPAPIVPTPPTPPQVGVIATLSPTQQDCEGLAFIPDFLNPIYCDIASRCGILGIGAILNVPLSLLGGVFGGGTRKLEGTSIDERWYGMGHNQALDRLHRSLEESYETLGYVDTDTYIGLAMDEARSMCPECPVQELTDLALTFAEDGRLPQGLMSGLHPRTVAALEGLVDLLMDHANDDGSRYPTEDHIHRSLAEYYELHLTSMQRGEGYRTDEDYSEYYYGDDDYPEEEALLLASAISVASASTAYWHDVVRSGSRRGRFLQVGLIECAIQTFTNVFLGGLGGGGGTGNSTGGSGGGILGGILGGIGNIFGGGNNNNTATNSTNTTGGGGGFFSNVVSGGAGIINNVFGGGSQTPPTPVTPVIAPVTPGTATPPVRPPVLPVTTPVTSVTTPVTPVTTPVTSVTTPVTPVTPVTPTAPSGGSTGSGGGGFLSNVIAGGSNLFSTITNQEAPATPVTTPVIPVTTPVTPVTTPVTPVTTPVTPVTTPVTPVTTPVTPVTTPITPVTTPITPVTTPVTPATTPITPVTTPVTPATTPITPVTTPATPVTTPSTGATGGGGGGFFASAISNFFGGRSNTKYAPKPMVITSGNGGNRRRDLSIEERLLDHQYLYGANPFGNTQYDDWYNYCLYCNSFEVCSLCYGDFYANQGMNNNPDPSLPGPGQPVENDGFFVDDMELLNRPIDFDDVPGVAPAPPPANLLGALVPIVLSDTVGLVAGAVISRGCPGPAVIGAFLFSGVSVLCNRDIIF